ncbi:hypothetical protein SDC9_194244 [bioreactor metagenome]|uniref:Uncharacterized protein n=1 Tax=bioreactor metagenome TaxID=1076179 RepID=A0A645IH17_9ZZZZ
MGPEGLEALVDTRLILAARQCPDDQFPNAVAHRLPHVLPRARGVAEAGEHVVDAVGQVIQRIEERSVQIK